MRMRPGGLLFILSALTTACSDNPTDSSAGPPSVIQVFAGDRQRAVVLSTLPQALVVEVLDSRGRPVGGQAVTFSTTSGGSFSPAQPVTSTDGQARTTYTLGAPAGEQVVNASVTGLTPAPFTVLADPGPAATIHLVSGGGQTGSVASALPAPIVVRVSDASDNPIKGVPVSFVPMAGSVQPSGTTTGATGEASAAWTLGTSAGQQALNVYAAGLAASVSATAAAGPAQSVTIVGGTGQTGGRGTDLPLPLVAQVADLYGNPKTGISVDFQASDGGTVSPGTVPTDGAGRASGTWTLGTRLGTQTATATVSGAGSATASALVTVPLRVLDHVAIDAVYDSVGDRLITVSADPSRLNVVNPTTGDVMSLSLDAVPTSVSVQPNGAYAAVGHNGFISYVNLTSLTVEKVYGVTTDVLDLELPGNGWVYAFPRVDQWESIRSIELSTGNETLSPYASIYAGTLVKLHPSGGYIYGANNGLSPSDFEKYDIRSGAAVRLYDSPYHGDYAFSGNLWMYDTGTRIIARSGNVFTSSSVQSQDMLYVGSIGSQWPVASAAQSTALQRVLVVRESGYYGSAPAELQSYSDAFLASRGTLPLPSYVETDGSGATSYVSQGRFVFAHGAGTRVYVLLRGAPPYEGRFNTGLAVFESTDIP